MKRVSKLFGFCPSGYNQIVVFTDEADFVKIMAANPGMTAIIQDSDHNVYVAGVTAGASLPADRAAGHLFATQK